jgi:hypothetical protein
MSLPIIAVPKEKLPTIPVLDNFIYQDEDDIYNEYKCELCQRPYTQPQLHRECQAIICKCWVEACKTLGPKSQYCPFCTKELDVKQLLPVAYYFNSYLDTLQVECSGCEHINGKPCFIDRGKIHTHLEKECWFSCSCGEMMRPREKENHFKNTCKEVEVECKGSKYCIWKGKRRDQNVHEKTCIMIPEHPVRFVLDLLYEQFR